MVMINELKIIGNLTEDTHKKVSIIKAVYGIRSMDETLKFILRVFKSVDDEERKKYIEKSYNEEFKIEENI